MLILFCYDRVRFSIPGGVDNLFFILLDALGEFYSCFLSLITTSYSLCWDIGFFRLLSDSLLLDKNSLDSEALVSDLIDPIGFLG